MNKTVKICVLGVLLCAVVALLIGIAVNGGNPNAMQPCPDECEAGFVSGDVICKECQADDSVDCQKCVDGKIGIVCATCEGAGEVSAPVHYGSWVALIAPVIAIVLALITKEVYSSLMIGVLLGGLLVANFDPVQTIDGVIQNGVINAVKGTAGIFAFLVILGIMVALVNKAGGSAAFGRWAQTHIKSRAGAMLCTFVLGVLIFIDDYFNCLTVGSVMRPVTDTHKISRSKLAYIIDATAAPICMIAPISSWAAAVSEYAPKGTSGIAMFVKAIPYNLYSLLTICFVVAMIVMKVDFGPMRRHELNALNGDLTSGGETGEQLEQEEYNHKGRVIDLLLPVIVLVAICVVALIYIGGFFGGKYNGDFVGAFGNTDATVGLPLGGFVALVLTILYLAARRIVSFKEAMACIPKGFIAMVPAILILTMATSLKNMTGLLGADVYVEGLVSGAAGLANFLPAIIFLVAIGLSFSTGTSWGTFGILIPIVVGMFEKNPELQIIGISACLAGAVCGDHCSPISDTTIMSSAGAQCNHVQHVSTQLPYALTVAAISFVGYVLAGVLQMVLPGFAGNVVIVLGVGLVLTIGTLLVIKILQKKKA